MSYHKDASGTDIHVLHASTYADIAARDADTAFHSVATNVNKIVLVDSPLAFYVLTSVTPTWSQLAGASGGGGDVVGPPSATDNAVARYDLATGKLIQDSSVTVDDLGTLVQGAGSDIPMLLATTSYTLNNGRGSSLQGGYFYVAIGDNKRLEIFDVAKPDAPVSRSVTVIPGRGEAIDVVGDYAYIAETSPDVLEIWDISNKSAPVLLGSVAIAVSARDIRVVGGIALIAHNIAGSALEAIDVSDPANPVVLDTLAFATGLRNSMRFVGDVAYVLDTAASGSLYTVDVSDPSNLAVLDTRAVAAGTTVLSVDVQGDYAYVGAGTDKKLFVFDVSDPSSIPSAVGSVLLTANAMTNGFGISASGGFIYLSNDTSDELYIVDISDPLVPVLKSTTTGLGGALKQLFSDGRFLYINRDQSFYTIDVTGVKARNLDVGHMRAGGISVLGDLDVAAALMANGATLGSRGLNSQGPVYARVGSVSRILSQRPDSTVHVFKASQLPTTLVANTRYLIMAPITITAGNEITIPNGGNITIQSVDRLNNTLSYTGTTGTLFTAAALTGSFFLRNVNITGGLVTSRLFNITGSGFPSVSILSGQYNNWGDLGTLSGLGGGVDVGQFGASGNLDGFKIVNSSFFGLNNSFIQNFSDTSSDFIDIASDVSRVAITLTGFVALLNERLLKINSSFTGEVILNTVFAIPTGRVFNSEGLDETSIYVRSDNVSNNPDSKSIGFAFVNGNTDATVIATQSVFVDLDLGTALAGSNMERWSLTNATTGEITYDGIEPFSGTLVATISANSSGGAQEFHFRAVKNGAVLPDLIETVLEIGSDTASASLAAPISVVNGDTVRLQVENVDGVTNIVVSHLSVSIQ